MNIIYMSLGTFDNLEDGSVHIDLIKRMAEDHTVYLLCKQERRTGKQTTLTEECGIHVLRVRTGNIKYTNLVEKGVSTILVEPQFVAAIKEYLSDVKFDLVIYTTPPITFANAVNYIKKRDGATCYLLLKDIFPQNAIDLGMLSKKGVKGIAYKYFRRKEKQLYKLSDRIGCMSEANCKYIIEHNPCVDKGIVEVCPNSFTIREYSYSDLEKKETRRKYGLPDDRTIFVYGGNLGKPQDIPFVIKCLETQKNRDDVFFLIVGRGTDYYLLENYIEKNTPTNIKVLSSLPKKQYEEMVAACDVGLIFLDHRFTIPNVPSRILSYMQARLPVFAVTDKNTDVGEIITNGGFGWWCESNDPTCFNRIIDCILKEDLSEYSQNSYNYLVENYNVDISYSIIMNSVCF